MTGPWLTEQGYLLGPAFALLVFLALFVGMLLWLYRPGSRRIYEQEARLPFDDGRHPGTLNPRPARED
jgi:cbb3-type cytochrome oxidase subunit 3